MKFSKLSQLALVSAIGLIVATLLTSCELVTIDFVYVAASAGASAGSAGQIYGYATDAQSGAIRSAVTPISSGGTSPVAMAMTSDFLNVYVANQGNNTVVHFTVADTGDLTPKDTITLPNTPVSIAVNSANTYLYVVSGASSATLTEYALGSGTIGSVTSSQPLTLTAYPTDTILSTGVVVLANNNAVYVTAYDKSAYNPGGTPFKTGNEPNAITIDPRGIYMYVTNSLDNSVSEYSISLPTGTPSTIVSSVAGSGNTTDTDPVSIAVEPSLGRYVYTANRLGNSISGFKLNPDTGALSSNLATPYPTGALPMAVIAVPHGNHATQSVTP
ncbi:MAG: beta-propeller fold lactonase family protein [Terracidiphilus sp.]